MNLKQVISKNKNLSGFAMDSVWTMIGLVAMNGIAQFVVYPFMRNMFGADGYGRILSMLGIINIVAVSIGTALNNSRLVAKAHGQGKDNRPYIQFLLIIAAVGVALSLAVFIVMKEKITVFSFLLYWLLMCMIVTRYYSEVEYRLHTNYVGLLCYYLIISAGYLIGMIFAKLSGQWALSLLTGEFAGFVFVAAKGSIYKRSVVEKRQTLGDIRRSAGYLMVAQLLVNLIFNSDRIILMAFCEGKTVTVYYIASAVGKMISFVTGSFNSVIIGYLAKKKETLPSKSFLKIFAVSSIAVILAIGACYVGSIIYTKLLYPTDYNAASPFFIVANSAQIFYFVSGMFTTILLRYAKENVQTRINAVYAVVFCITSIPTAYFFGIWGYAIGVLIADLFRYVLAAVLCYRKLKNLEKSSVVNQ